MADPVERDTLIVSPTPREAAVAAAEASASDLDTGLIQRAGSPDIAQVPADYLPARAQARSVDLWDETWPEAIKRAVIVAAPDVHRHKGTVYAVKASLAALRIDAVVTEWWQQTPRGVPYTFTVKAYTRARLYDGPLLDPRVIAAAYGTVLRVKPASRAFDLVLGASFPRSVGLAPVLVGKVRLARAAVPTPNTHTVDRIGFAPVLVGKVRLARAMVPKLPA